MAGFKNKRFKSLKRLLVNPVYTKEVIDISNTKFPKDEKIVSYLDQQLKKLKNDLL